MTGAVAARTGVSGGERGIGRVEHGGRGEKDGEARREASRENERS